MAQLPSALACHLSSVASSEVPLAWTAKSMIVVVPPQAAARVPVSKVSTEEVPPNGISMCVCTSIPPGRTYLPVASMTRSAASAAGASAGGRPGSPVRSLASTAAIFSPATSTSASSVPEAVTTVPPEISVVLIFLPSLASGAPLGAAFPPRSSLARQSRRHRAPLARSGWARSRLDQRLVLVGPAVPVELPQVPDLGQLFHVQVAHQHLVLVVGGGVADELPARAGEVGLAVEVVVAERLDADPV